ncbi:MAG: DUF2148 domain-containing protein [Prevotellaceae bacterium]|jgi:uncharacterized ferredoxin-like protein|nr:DUF2148 domain-containing protein [Prevotellaceae bacterium]
MILNERECRHEEAVNVGRMMMAAARTAPKAKGVDIVETALITGEELELLATKMEETAQKPGRKFFLRDAMNVRQAECVFLLGTKILAMGLNCGHCGADTCDERGDDVPCAVNAVDVGIAIGSACAAAADHRVDTRVMFSAGLVAQQLNYLPDCRLVFAVLIGISSKNAFFDRKPLN